MIMHDKQKLLKILTQEIVDFIEHKLKKTLYVHRKLGKPQIKLQDLREVEAKNIVVKEHGDYPPFTNASATNQEKTVTIRVIEGANFGENKRFLVVDLRFACEIKDDLQR